MARQGQSLDLVATGSIATQPTLDGINFVPRAFSAFKTARLLRPAVLNAEKALGTRLRQDIHEEQGYPPIILLVFLQGSLLSILHHTSLVLLIRSSLPQNLVAGHLSPGNALFTLGKCTYTAASAR